VALTTYVPRPAPTRRLSRSRLLALSAAAGIALGVLVQLEYSLPGNSGTSLANLGAPWLAVAFGLGAVARSRRDGALAGIVGLMFGLISFYVYMRVIQDTPTPPHKWAWFVLGVLGGAGFGAAGTTWRSEASRPRLWATALLTGTLTAESVGGLVRAAEGTLHPVSIVIFVIELLAGLGVPFLLLRDRDDRALAYGYTIGAAVALVAVAIVITTAAHR
jgi:hypothetical protein